MMKEIWSNKSSLIVKLWINQFAFSLFGLFVSSPFLGNYTLCTAAGIFSLLFYLAVVAFAVLDDAQKDRIAYNAGRAPHLSAAYGMKYIGLSFAPSCLLTLVHLILSLCGAKNVVRTALYLLDRFALAGEVLGIDIGLAKPGAAEVAGEVTRVNSGLPAFSFMSDAGIFQLLFVLIAFGVLSAVYALAFKGIIVYNTTSKKNK